MTLRARNLWPDLPTLAHWFEKNCTNCRYRFSSPPEDPTAPRCTLPDNAHHIFAADPPIGDNTAVKIFGPRYLNARDQYTTAPARCAQRKDRRGRPRKDAAQHTMD